MGRHKSPESYKTILRELAESRRLDTTRRERNLKILRMLELGCSYEDVGRRYGLSPLSIPGMIRREFGGRGRKFPPNDLARACFVD